MVCADWIRSCERSISRTASAWITCKIAIIIIKFLFITHTCNGVIKPTILWLILSTIMNGVIKSSSQIYCCHGRVAASKAYNYYQLREVSSCWPMSRTVSAWITCKTSGRIHKGKFKENSIRYRAGQGKTGETPFPPAPPPPTARDQLGRRTASRPCRWCLRIRVGTPTGLPRSSERAPPPRTAIGP